MKNFKKKLDAFPTQLILTIVWAIPISGYAMLTDLGSNLKWITFISLYAIVISHFTGHIAWKAEQASLPQEDATTPSAKRTD